MKPLRFISSILERLFPSNVVYFLGALYGWLKPANRSYSQKGEDILIHCYFNRKKNGTYIDVGCFHPRWVSNTHLLHKHGWTGTVVDLDWYKLKAFEIARGSKVKTICAGVTTDTSHNSEAVIYRFKRPLGWSDMDTLDSEAAQRTKDNGGGDFSCKKIKTISINSLLARQPCVDLLSIDIEGLDTSIVLAIDFTTCKPKAILFEDNLNFGGNPKVVEHLKSNGYFHLFTSGGSVCFAMPKT